MRRALVLAVLVLVSGSACSGTPSPSTSSRDVWQKLHRPLHVGMLAPGARCPVSPVDRGFRFARYGVGRGIGPGPAYPVSRGAALRIEFPPPAATDFSTGAWGGQRVMWLISSAYRGPLLVRGTAWTVATRCGSTVERCHAASFVSESTSAAAGP